MAGGLGGGCGGRRGSAARIRRASVLSTREPRASCRPAARPPARLLEMKYNAAKRLRPTGVSVLAGASVWRRPRQMTTMKMCFARPPRLSGTSRSVHSCYCASIFSIFTRAQRLDAACWRAAANFLSVGLISICHFCPVGGQFCARARPTRELAGRRKKAARRPFVAGGATATRPPRRQSEIRLARGGCLCPVAHSCHCGI